MYNSNQAAFVEKSKLEVGSKVRLVSTWHKGEQGFDFGKSGMPINLMVGRIFKVVSINETSITLGIVDGLGQTECLKAPYFALEVIK